MKFMYFTGQRGKPKILFENHTYICSKHLKNRKYWTCGKQRSQACRARLITDSDNTMLLARQLEHTHPPDMDILRKSMLYSPK